MNLAEVVHAVMVPDENSTISTIVAAATLTSTATLMARTPDGTMHTIKAVEVEHHDRETSTGGTTIWLDIEEF